MQEFIKRFCEISLDGLALAGKILNGFLILLAGILTFPIFILGLIANMIGVKHEDDADHR